MSRISKPWAGFVTKMTWVWPWLICLVLIGIATSVTYARVISVDVPLYSDEHAHAMSGLVLATDLARGDPISLIWDTYSSVYYPPIYYWLEAFSFTLLGPSRVSARLVSLAASGVLALLLVAVGRLLRSDKNPWIGVIAFGFAMISVPLGLLVGQAMLESTGLTMLTLTLWAYFKATKDGRGWRYALAGTLIVLTYLTRAHYGILSLGVILLNEAIQVGLEIWRSRTMPERLQASTSTGPRAGWITILVPILALLVPVVTFLVFWFGFFASGTFDIEIRVQQAMTIFSEGYLGSTMPNPLSPDGLLFFPSKLGYLGGSWLVIAILLGAWALAIRRWQDKRLRALILLVAFEFLVAEFSPNKQVRFMVVLLPPLGLLAGYWIIEAIQRGAKRHARLPAIAALMLVLLFVVHEAVLIRDIQPVSDTTADAVVQWIDGKLRDQGPALVVTSGEIAYPQPTFLDWHLVTESRLMGALGADSLFHWTYGPWFSELVTNRFRQIGLAGLGEQWAAQTESRVPVRGQTRTLYLDFHDDNLKPQTATELADILKGAIDDSGLEGLIVLVLEKEPSRYPAGLYDSALESLGFQISDVRAFPEAPARVFVYQRRIQP